LNFDEEARMMAAQVAEQLERDDEDTRSKRQEAGEDVGTNRQDDANEEDEAAVEQDWDVDAGDQYGFNGQNEYGGIYTPFGAGVPGQGILDPGGSNWLDASQTLRIQSLPILDNLVCFS
jgi:hypothetical protein